MQIDVQGFRTFLEPRVSDGTATRYLFLVQQDAGPARVRERSLSPKYRRQIRSSWRAYARYLTKAGKDAAAREILDQVDEVRLPPAVRQKVQLPLPRPFYDRLRAAIDSCDEKPAVRAVLGIMANRGIRRGDVLRATRTDVARALKTATFSFMAKGHRRLEFGLLDSYKRYLELLREAFADDKDAETVGQLVAGTDAAAEKRIARALRRVAAELPLKKHELTLEDVRPHILRRTYATVMFEAFGFDPVKLTSHMQWASVTTALGYVDAANRGELDAIAEKTLSDARV